MKEESVHLNEHDDDGDIILEDLSSISLTEKEQEKIGKKHEYNDFMRNKLEKDAKKNWDLFYKRNGDRFFKNRHWTKREFKELFHKPNETHRFLLEIGCGCGDFVLPLLEVFSSQTNLCDERRVDSNKEENKNNNKNNLFIYCCDISDQAISILKAKPQYTTDEERNIKAFVADITGALEPIHNSLDGHQMDIVSLIFVLSALDPEKMRQAVDNIYKLTRKNGLILFRDYAMYDKAMLRFSENSKICDNFYVRQDGTRAYFFTKTKLLKLFENFHCQSIEYIKRETVNHASKERFSRIFLQAKFSKQ